MNTGTLTPSSVLGRNTKLSIRFPSKLGTFTFSATTSVYTSLESRSRYTDGGTAPRCTGGRRSDPGSSPSTHPATANVSKANAVNHARDMKGEDLARPYKGLAVTPFSAREAGDLDGLRFLKVE